MLDFQLIRTGLSRAHELTGAFATPGKLTTRTADQFVAAASNAAEQLRTLAGKIEGNEELSHIIGSVADEASSAAAAAGAVETHRTLAHPLVGETVLTQRAQAERALALANAHVSAITVALDASRMAIAASDTAATAPGIEGHAKALQLLHPRHLSARVSDHAGSESIAHATFAAFTRDAASPHRDAILGELMSASAEVRAALAPVSDKAARMLEHPGTVYDLDSLLQVGQRELRSATYNDKANRVLRDVDDFIANVPSMSNRELAIVGPGRVDQLWLFASHVNELV